MVSLQNESNSKHIPKEQAKSKSVIDSNPLKMPSSAFDTTSKPQMRRRPRWGKLLSRRWGSSRSSQRASNEDHNHHFDAHEDHTATAGSAGTAKEESDPASSPSWQAKVERLEQELAQMQAENDAKDQTIQSLERQLSSQQSLSAPENANEVSTEPQMTEPFSLLPETAPSFREGTIATTQENIATETTAQSLQEFLLSSSTFPERSLSDDHDMASFLSAFVQKSQTTMSSLDRVFLATRQLHPELLSTYTWNCTAQEPTNVGLVEIPHVSQSSTAIPISQDEPLFDLPCWNGVETQSRVNVRSDTTSQTSTSITNWMKERGCTDYLALSLGTNKGAMVFCTKATTGWSESQIQFWKHLWPTLSLCLTYWLQSTLVLPTLTHTWEETAQAQTQEGIVANAKIQQLQSKIIQQAQAQLRHFAIMSHEIRTPLNCIIGLSNLILIESGDKLEDSIKEPIEMMASSGDLLLAVVDDVLDYSKLAAGRVETHICRSNLWTSVNTVVFAIRTQARYENGVQIRTNFAPNLPKFVQTDSRRLQQVLYNILGNAIKFGREGKFVDFKISVVGAEEAAAATEQSGSVPTTISEGEQDTSKFLKFSILDHGKGIEPSEYDRIFEPFQQSSKHKVSAGTGLGLSITRQLVRVLGGSISVKSDYGKWCEFQVLLPCDVDDIQPQREKSMASLAQTRSPDEFAENTSTNVSDKNLYKHIERQLSLSDLRAMKIEDGFATLLDDSSHSVGGSSATAWDEESTGGLMSLTSARSTLHAPPPPSDTHPLWNADKYKETKQVPSSSSDGPKFKDSPLLESANEEPSTPPQIVSVTRASANLKNEDSATPIETPIMPPFRPTVPQSVETSSTDVGLPVSPPTSASPQHKMTATEKATPTLPAQAVAAAPESGNGADDDSAILAKLTVLVAEDNIINQKVLCRTLKRIGIADVDVVENGQLAVDASSNKEYDIILMDLEMPVMDGLDATRIITKRPKRPKVVFVSAHALPEYKKQAKEAGGDDFLSKPVKLGVIKEVLVQRYKELHSH